MTESVTQTEQKIAEDTLAFCMEHMQEHYTIQFLAQRAGISPTKLKSIFRRTYGIPLFAYIRAEKMRLSARQLAEANSRILDIAEACGYDNASKFSAAFRDVIGCSPKEYRKKYCKNVRSE